MLELETIVADAGYIVSIAKLAITTATELVPFIEAAYDVLILKQPLTTRKGRHWPLFNRVLLNDGHGGFNASNLGTAPDRAYSAALADIDGDGHLDIVVSNDAIFGAAASAVSCSIFASPDAHAAVGTGTPWLLPFASPFGSCTV